MDRGDQGGVRWIGRDGGAGGGELEEEEMNSARYDRSADGEKDCGCEQQTTTAEDMVSNLSRCFSSCSYAIQEFQTNWQACCSFKRPKARP